MAAAMKRRNAMIDNDCHDHDIIHIKRQDANQHSAGLGFPGILGLILFFGVCYLISLGWNAIENWQFYEAPTKYVLFIYHYLIYEPLAFGKTINDYLIVHTFTPYSNLNFVIKWVCVIFYYFGLFCIYLKYVKILEKFGYKKYRFLILLIPAIVLLIFYFGKWLFS
ncbi:hypothetical protein [Acinetobacter baumannii]|uniref:hypothetical protein n=1 Tax=Acinetobacter baumannii TaxID=470 RepID=UPI00387DC0B3